MSRHTAGPVESLARLAIQSDRYRTDHEFRDAVDAVLCDPLYDAAPDMLAALKAVAQWVEMRTKTHPADAWDMVRAAIARAEGLS